MGVGTYGLYRSRGRLLDRWFLGARLETGLAPCCDWLFDQLADGLIKSLNVGIMALVLLLEFIIKRLGEFPVCAGRLPEGRISGHKGRMGY